MEKAREKKRRGSALIEFSITFVPLLFLQMSIVSVALNMWEFHSLDYAVDSTTRYITVHGQGCSQNGNSCTVTVGNIISFFQAQALGADATQVSLTLTDGSGSTTCSPITSCSSSTTQFPNASYNSPGSDITLNASFTMRNPLAMYWPPASNGPHDFTVYANSRQRMAF